jgi:hypothetical protein
VGFALHASSRRRARGQGGELQVSSLLLRVILVAAAIAAAVFWWERLRTSWIAQGVLEEHARQEVVNARAHTKRENEISGFREEMLQANAGLQRQLGAKDQEIDRLNKERGNHVSPAADSRCIVPRGLVRDLDGALPGAAGRAAVSDAGGDQDAAAGVSLSWISGIIRGNYGQCAKYIERLSGFEQRRYEACLAWDAKWGTHSGCEPPAAVGAP